MGACDGPAVLVANDNVDVLDFVELFVSEAGATVRIAKRGREVLDLLPAWKPDVLVLDISLPDIDGYRLLSAARLLPGLHDVPAIAVTGYAPKRIGSARRTRASRSLERLSLVDVALGGPQDVVRRPA